MLLGAELDAHSAVSTPLDAHSIVLTTQLDFVLKKWYNTMACAKIVMGSSFFFGTPSTPWGDELHHPIHSAQSRTKYANFEVLSKY